MAPRVSVFSRISDPLTRAFRYNVIGLSPVTTMNNFLANSVAMVSELGPQSLKHWGKAVEILKNPRAANVPDELVALIRSEHPYLEHLDQESWMARRLETQVGLNAKSAFDASATATALKQFGRNAKAVTDYLVSKNLQAMRWGDNVFRAMTYLDQLERGKFPPGMSRGQAENAAVETARQLFVDHAAYTPVERVALRSIIPFYSYMGQALRIVGRYPLNHPIRASIASHVAQIERERLGALPGGFLSFLPIPGLGMDEQGHRTFLNARPFDPFGDTASLFSVAGWLSATNPLIQTALRTSGMIRGESELYPTLRYDPETGRMRAVHPGLLESAIYSTIPRFGAIGTVLGLNPSYNELRQRDQPAAARFLAGQFGLPRLYRDVNVYQEMTKAELTRQQSANDVLNQAMRTGNWGEALRYPSLAAYYDQIQTLSPEQIAAMSPASQEELAEVMEQTFG